MTAPKERRDNWSRFALLRNVPAHSIIRYQDRWGVICRDVNGSRSSRIVDFWEGGRETVPIDVKVEVLK